LGFEHLQSLWDSPPPAGSLSDVAPSRRSRTVPELRGSASHGVLAPTNTSTSGALSPPRASLSVARGGRESPHSRRCRPQGSCPSRRFRPARGSFEAFWTPPFAVAPDASRPSFMPLASLERPFRAFPSRGAVPALAGRFFLAGSRSTAAGAESPRSSLSLSPLRASSLPFDRPKADPGRMSRDDGSPRSLVRSPRPAERAARAVPIPRILGSPVSGRHARFEALLPSGVRSATASMPGQAETARRCSLGILTLQSSLHHGSGFGISQIHTQGARGPVLRAPPGAQPSRLHSATRTPTPRLANLGSVDTQNRSNSACHHQAVTQLTRAPLERCVRQPPAPSAPSRTLRTERLACAPSRRHPAPPALHARFPRKGPARWASKTLESNHSPAPAPHEAGWRPRSSRCVT